MEDEDHDIESQDKNNPERKKDEREDEDDGDEEEGSSESESSSEDVPQAPKAPVLDREAKKLLYLEDLFKKQERELKKK